MLPGELPCSKVGEAGGRPLAVTSAASPYRQTTSRLGLLPRRGQVGEATGKMRIQDKTDCDVTHWQGGWSGVIKRHLDADHFLTVIENIVLGQGREQRI